MDDDERDVADEGMGPDAEGSGKEGPDSDRTDQLEEDSSDSETVEAFPDEDEGDDTTAAQVRHGRDVQGIPWDTTQWTRASYRTKRDAEYPTYFNQEAAVNAAQVAIAAEAVPRRPPAAGPWFEFYRNWRRVRADIVHFQLRNLLWATSSHDLYYVSANRVMHWSNVRRDDPTVVMDVSGRGPGAVAPGLGPIQLCTLCVKEGLIAGGGFGGELVAQHTGQTGLAASMRVTSADNGITNAIDIHRSPSGALLLALSNNDAALRLVDAEAWAPLARFDMRWAVNYACFHPSGRLLCGVGDDPVSHILDLSSGRTVLHLRGHVDFAFAAAWHPDGMVVATGNQDLTTRIYDLRAPGRTLALLRAHIGAVRSLRFSPDGRFLAVAEAADYVTLYDAAAGYTECQTVDMFGEIAGTAFTPDSQRLWVGMTDVHYASAMQLDRTGAEFAVD